MIISWTYLLHAFYRKNNVVGKTGRRKLNWLSLNFLGLLFGGLFLGADTALPSQGDTMFMPPPPQTSAAVVTTYLQKHAIGQCDVLDSGFGSLHNDDSLSPITIAEAFFKDFDFHDAQIEILTEPKHGILESAPVDAPNQPFPAAHAENTTYIANEGYVGHDKFSVRVWDKKYDVTIYYDVQSFDGLPSLDIANDNPWCDGHPSFGSFKISASGMEFSPLPNANPTNINLQFSRRNRDRNRDGGS
jgi:hypothetical protein